MAFSGAQKTGPAEARRWTALIRHRLKKDRYYAQYGSVKNG